MDSSLPADVVRLLWDIDPSTLDLQEHSDYVLERVMARGGWVAMCWLRQVYPTAVLADFLTRKGERLAPRERAYWRLMADLPPESDRLGGGRPGWAGP